MLFSKELLLDASKYKKDEVVAEYTNPGTYTINILQKGIYEIEAISGGGSGGAWWYHPDWGVAIFGGTGAYYKGTFSLNKGSYSISVGAGGTNYYGGGGTSITDVLALSGGSGTYNVSLGVYSSDGGYLTFAASGVTDVTYIAGHGATNTSVGNPTPGAHGNEPISAYVPQALSGYGNGGGFNGFTYYPGTGGYLKITYKGRK